MLYNLGVFSEQFIDLDKFSFQILMKVFVLLSE